MKLSVSSFVFADSGIRQIKSFDLVHKAVTVEVGSGQRVHDGTSKSCSFVQGQVFAVLLKHCDRCRSGVYETILTGLSCTKKFLCCSYSASQEKDGCLTLCVDFRRLNSNTINNQFPVSRIEALIDAISGAKWFSTRDLASGFNQVAMEDKDRQQIAFTTPFRIFEYNRMSLGLTSSPAAFQPLMQTCLNDYIPGIQTNESTSKILVMTLQSSLHRNKSY